MRCGSLASMLAGLPAPLSFFRTEKVKMSTMASTGLELESEPSWKGKLVTSTLWQVLVRDVRLSNVG